MPNANITLPETKTHKTKVWSATAMTQAQMYLIFKLKPLELTCNPVALGYLIPQNVSRHVVQIQLLLLEARC